MKEKLFAEFIHIHEILKNKTQHTIVKLFVMSS